jgi:hypothetical protein
MFICMDFGYTFCEPCTNYPAIAVIVVRCCWFVSGWITTPLPQVRCCLFVYMCKVLVSTYFKRPAAVSSTGVQL